MNEVTDKEMGVLFSRINRCYECLERWVDNPSITINVACLLTVKVVCRNTKDTEQKTLSTLYSFLEKYIKKEFERNR